MDVIARYPEFSPLSLEAVQAIRPDLQLLKDGMSELTFGSLYFFALNFSFSFALAKQKFYRNLSKYFCELTFKMKFTESKAKS